MMLPILVITIKQAGKKTKVTKVALEEVPPLLLLRKVLEAEQVLNNMSSALNIKIDIIE